jgi:hypothetical protein
MRGGVPLGSEVSVPMMVSLRHYLLVLAVAVLFCAGCGEEPTYPVHGKIVYRDTKEPVEAPGMILMFASTKPPHAQSSSAIGPGGTFSMISVGPDSGSLAGEHRVRVVPSLMGNDPEGAVARVMHRKYYNFDTSGLTVEVKAKGENNITIEVDRDPKPPAAAPVNLNP